MKLNGKSLMLVLSAGIVFSLTGCDGKSTPPAEEPPATEVTYTDYKGETRTAAVDPGDSEVLTGVGYQHTLFDTAEKKCQHCHNRLFDTWKSSMHAKSWSDKIFQTKYQDFLRTHIAKIGTVSKDDNGTTYTTDTFGKVGKTCVKCHAPGAFYSEDIKITLDTNDSSVTDLNVTQWGSLQAALEDNIASHTDFTPHEPTTVASIDKDGVLRTATYSIGHPNNREGINCATCHSIETVRMLRRETGDEGEYNLTAPIRGNVIGDPVRYAGDILYYDEDPSQPDMNIFFKLVGPEKYNDLNKSPHSVDEFDVDKKHDGRYTFRGIDLNGTHGKTHYTGGPFYGPYGVTGLDNSNADDDTNRSAQVNPMYHKEDNNHFNESGKGLCLSCHQRSAGAIVPGSDPKAFMELCTTWTAVSNGDDSNANDSDFSPKCQKCHMARVDEDFVLHQWAEPFTHFTQQFMAENNKTALTPHFDPDDETVIDNPVRDKWMNDHAFIGGNKLTGGNYINKFKSGFEVDLNVERDGNGGAIHVITRLTNKTAHMFPGAHPMRRVLTRVIVTDENGVEQNVTSAHGESTFADITNEVVTGKDTDTISDFGDDIVHVLYNENREINYQGKAEDLDGEQQVYPQDFNGSKPTLIGVDGTVKNQYTDGTTIKGKVFNAAIVTLSEYDSRFTRIYGRETGKYFDLSTGAPTKPSTEGAAYIVRPGFDSNIVPDGRDNRLQPNESEEYRINYTNLEPGEYTVTFKVYYMQKGANGQFPENDEGWLDPVVNKDKSLIITEMESLEERVLVIQGNPE